MPGLWIGIFVGLIIGAAAAAAATWYILKPRNEEALQQFNEELARRRETAEKESEQILNTAANEAKQIRLEAEKVIEKRYDDLAKAEERVDNRSAAQDRQAAKLEQREQKLNKRQSRLDKSFNDLTQQEEEQQQKLQEIANMTVDEARGVLLAEVEKESRQDMARVMREIEDEARETADAKARNLIAMAMQRIASDQVAEMTVSVVPLPSEEMKGRIIGRNGRNIRAFEQAAGVDIVVDDTPEAVTVSSFDPVRREIARRALEKLITDGRIHPARIEKLIKDAGKEVEQVIKEAGEQAAYEANVHGLNPQILRMLGRLKYRTSYGQNQLHHSVEAAKIASVLASELGANVEMAKMGALLHDLGKAMDHEQEGTHAMLGAEFAKRFRVPPIVINAIASHHHEVEQESVEAIIVETADAISGARPGARRESLENYIKRVRTLEDIATSYDGVESAYALQAGREIRILVKPGAIDDLGAMRLSKDIARTIEDSMQYPGQIQVTVIRETRAVGFAK
ncbi:MAG: ribonuclease Y [Chloroflexi bacterium]|nr:ribonuclease Y [Chloroflexota bacterium]MBK7179148.1 ribonuclease Y [Chloroflexota bacterium]MBK8932166.1 ribonuclease Y [Chloroflexota bacterium]MBP6802812.1 ribonuclease Y [Chloroflexota bacterium]MBP7591204.1 ribonuclease Y [Chloroflexota bacterium]